ncbi:MAG: hypothetical protein WA040_09175 [Anaerolineae bacterium]
MQSEETLHCFIQEGHDPLGWPKCLEAKREPGCDVPINVERREFDVTPGIGG